MTDPDYGPLALRLGDAANILEEVSTLYGYTCPAAANWSAADLRHEAKQLSDNT